MLQPGNVGDFRLHTGGHQIGASLEHAACGEESVGAGEPSLAANDVEPVGGGDVHVFGPPQVPHQDVFLRDQCRQVDLACAGRHSVECLVFRGMTAVGSGQQHLRRHTADIHAGAAYLGALDDRHGSPVQSGMDRGGHRCPTRSDHSQAELGVFRHACPSARPAPVATHPSLTFNYA